VSLAFGRQPLSHRDLRRALTPIDIRGGVYRLTGEVRTVNRSADQFVSGLIDRVEGEPIRYIGQSLPGFEVGREVYLEGYVDVHPGWGAQYRVDRVISSTIPREARGLSSYMSANIPGVGDVWADRMIDAFGPNVLSELREDPRIVRRAWPKSAQARKIEFGIKSWIRSTVDEAWSYSVAPELMKAVDVTYGTARRICDFFTSAEVADLIVRRDPYRLLDVPGLGWKRVDAIALSMGIAGNALERYEGAVRAALMELPLDGSTAFLRSELIRNVVGRIKGERKLASRAVATTALGGELMRFRGLLVPPARYDLSWAIADKLLTWSAPTALDAADEAKLAKALAARRLTAEQKAAVRGVFMNSVFLLTGGPGTGKTYTLRSVIEAAGALRMGVTIVAPTGKAASRASEVAKHKAQTIHKALGGPVGMEAKNGPIPQGLLIVEESSMLDQEVAAWLLRNCRPDRTRLLLVGDDKQLPPVGPGAVFRDLLGSNRFPGQALAEVHRQAQGSPIIRAAHAIRTGGRLPTDEQVGYQFLELPEDPNRASDHFMVRLAAHIEEERRSESRQLTSVHRFDPRQDLQVLTTRNSGPLGTKDLNQRIQALLNPSGAVGPLISGGASVRVGDRLICTTNDYSIGDGIFNGEQGIVVGVGGNRIRMKMEDGRTVITQGPVQNGIWALAYAITVHKSQGSEYPIVILLLHASQYPVLDRRILYTGLTRAKERVLLAGDPKGLRISENRTDSRRTILGSILCEA
jgi:exodeoxyribonuclease V alpha subunit